MAPPLTEINQDGFIPSPIFTGEGDSTIGLKKLGRSMRTLRLPQNYGIIVKSCVKLDEEEAQDNRTALKRAHKVEFRNRFAQFLGVTVASLEDWEIHHIRPVCIGGSNHFANLDLIPHDEHVPLHQKVLDPQTFATACGKRQDFIIPVRMGRLVVEPGLRRPRGKARIRPEHLAALNGDF